MQFQTPQCDIIKLLFYNSLKPKSKLLIIQMVVDKSSVDRPIDKSTNHFSTRSEVIIKYEKKHEFPMVSREDAPSFCIPIAHGTEPVNTSHISSKIHHSQLCKRVHSISVLWPFPSDWTNVWSAPHTTTLTDIVQPTEGTV